MQWYNILRVNIKLDINMFDVIKNYTWNTIINYNNIYPFTFKYHTII